MPSRMEEIAARSAKSGSEYLANKARNDALAESYSRRKRGEDEKRKSVLKKTTNPYGGMSSEQIRQLRESKQMKPAVVLSPKAAPTVVAEPPVDLIDYSLSPQSMEVPWSRLPAGGSLFGLNEVVGTMMVMLGKRMLVSMAITGLNVLAMEPLQQYGRGLPRARVLWHTGRSSGTLKKRALASQGFYVPPPGAEDDPLALAKEVLQFGSDVSDWVSEQVRTYFGFGGWLD